MNKEITNFIKDKLPIIPLFGLVLGSGLSSLIDDVKDQKTIPYDEIPNFLQTTVSGHVGEFIFGYIGKIPILCAKGRFHYYEGKTIDEVTSIIKIFKEIGTPNVIITNSAGCVNPQWEIGDIMLISGHLDFTFREKTPQIICGEPMYPQRNLNFVRNIADELNIPLREGNYTWTLGPTYETPAEINKIRELGGHAVGMSTLPEIEKAHELGLNCWAFSNFTNMGAGMQNVTLTHGDVLEASTINKDNFKKLIQNIIERYKNEPTSVI